MATSMIVLHRVREVRLERGLSQLQLGELLDMDAAQICRLERKIRSPRISTLQAIATVLHVTLSELLPQDT